jgi:hypothetical protein
MVNIDITVDEKGLVIFDDFYGNEQTNEMSDYETKEMEGINDLIGTRLE